MASNEIEVTASLEVLLHNNIREFLQDLANEHGVMVEMVEAQWVDVSTVEAPQYLVTGIRLQTLANGPTDPS